MASNFGLGDLAAAGLSNVGVGPLNVGNVLDTVEFVKKAWSSFGVPASYAPTANLDELDRRIADLKAVEQWLALNLNMLQGTIQAVEIQRGTIATLKAYGGALGVPSATIPGAQAIAKALSASMQPLPAGGGQPHDAGERGRELHSGEPGRSESTAARQPAGEPAAAAGSPQTAAIDPGAWWDLLQGQFNQIASAAMSGVGLPSLAPGAAGDAANQHAAGRKDRRARRGAHEGAPVAPGSGKGSSTRKASASASAAPSRSKGAAGRAGGKG